MQAFKQEGKEMKCLINQYMAKHRIGDSDMARVGRLYLNNGESLSVQAGEYNYCSPRRSHEDHYYQVEVGFPSEVISSIMDYAEYPNTPLDTVYGYVPVGLINEYILECGGIDHDKSKRKATQ